MALNSSDRPSDSAAATPKLANSRRDWAILAALWLAATLVDGLWLWIDQAPPAWDQGDHLARALSYWRVLQQPDIENADWWQTLWRLSPSYRAPFVYLMTVPFLQVLGRGFDQAVLVNSLFTALLLILVYALARHLFDRTTGLWAAAACTLVPFLLIQRVDYLLDYGLVVCVLAGFSCLTYWRTGSRWSRWIWALGFGICCGLTVLAKPTGLLFLLVPMLWVAIESLRRSPLVHILQWIAAAGLALLVCGPWFSTNWLTILTSSGSSNSSWIAAELDPQNPVSVWSYYARMLPRMITPPLLWAGLAGWIAGLIAWRAHWVKPLIQPEKAAAMIRAQWLWVLSFILGTYGLLSLLHNKDPRHILPCVPVVVIVLMRGLTAWSGFLWRWLRLGLIAVMVVLAVGTLFPVTQLPPLKVLRHPYQQASWPQPDIIDAVITADPYLRSTIGVLPNLDKMNPMNVDFYGALRDFRVYGREVGFSPDYAPLDVRSLTWVLAKTGEQGPGSGGSEGKRIVQQQVEQSPDYQATQSWTLPDSSQLTLYHRQPAPIEVRALNQPLSQVKLTAATVAPSAQANSRVPVTYQIEGPWQALADGLLVLTWQANVGGTNPPHWINDHGIGLGNLYAGSGTPASDQGFVVTERLGLQIPAGTSPGSYRLVAQYVNRETGERYPLASPGTTLTVGPGDGEGTGPEPDLVAQLHTLSQGLADGTLDPIFNAIGRINQYDPRQDYLVQAEQAMEQRLQQDASRLEWLYTQLMAQVLQQKAKAAIATLHQITQIAPDNPYHWLYLGFVHLYRWQPSLANQALDRAETLAPTMPELKVLQAVAALQRLNLPRAWRLIQASGVLG